MSTATLVSARQARYCPIHKKPVKEHGSAFYCPAGHSVSRYKLLDADVLDTMAEEQEADTHQRGRRIDPPEPEPEAATIKPEPLPAKVHGVIDTRRFVCASGSLIVRLLKTKQGRYRVNWRREQRESGEDTAANIYDGTSQREAEEKFSGAVARAEAKGWQERSHAALKFQDIPDADPGELPPARARGGRRKAR